MTVRVRNRDTKLIARKHLLPDPLNWHTHPDEQRRALAAVFAEVGFVGHLLVRHAPGQRGKYYIVDGHERAEHFAPDEKVPCCILDVTEAEARKLLLSYDPLGFLGGIDQETLNKLDAEISIDHAELDAIVREALSGLADEEEEPHYQPAGPEQQGRLDQQNKTRCPECGHEF